MINDQHDMPYNSLQQFISKLNDAGELHIINEHISPELEMTEIVDRISKNNGKAVLFNNNGTAFPVLMNAFGSQKRMLIALGLESYNEFEIRLNNLFDIATRTSKGLNNKLKILNLIKDLNYSRPKHKKRKGECQEVVITSPDLSALPILKCWPYDGGKFITLPMVHTKDPETGIVNTGIYRMQVFDKKTTGMHWHRHKGGAAHYEKYKYLGKLMPVVVTLGGDPVYTYSASAPLPEIISEYLFAGYLLKKRVNLVKCLTCEIEVPDDVDFVFEGYIDPQEELITEGPFGDHTGFYSLPDKYPVFHITHITHRKNAVYPATIVGIPPMEDAYIGQATERLFLPLIKKISIPEIENIYLPVEGGFHNLAIVSINKSYPGQAIKVMNAIWGTGQLMFVKNIVVVDKQTNIFEAKAVLNSMMCNIQLPTDLHFMHGPLDVLDHANSKFCLGKKMGFDATKKLKEETKNNNNNIIYSIDIEKIIDELPYINVIKSPFAECNNKIVIAFVNKSESPELSEVHQILITEYKINIQFIIYLDSSVSNFNNNDLLWLLLANFDPEKDLFFDNSSFTSNIGIDGTLKIKSKEEISYIRPNVITMDRKIIEKIDNIWSKLNIGEFLSSPSNKYFNITMKEGYLYE